MYRIQTTGKKFATLLTVGLLSLSVVGALANTAFAVNDNNPNNQEHSKPKLTVIKHVINDNGGTSTASSFTLKVKTFGEEESDTISTFPGSEAGTLVALPLSRNSHSYIVSENVSSGYAATYSGDCDSNGKVSLKNNQNKTCIVTNNDVVRPENTSTLCGDTLDNDGDGLVDLSDPDCAAFKLTPAVIIVVTKIVCDSESSLPNLGQGGNAPISSTTATDFITHNDGACHLAADWSFQWGDQNSTNPGDDFVGEASGLTTFGPTGANGVATTSIPLTGNMSEIHLREVLKDGYIPFTFGQSQDNSNNVSAEFYCANDVVNYDNFDFITTPRSGMTYNCVAWNVKKPVVPPQVCPEGTTGEYPNCTPITETNDVCPNIAGVQSTLPEGRQLSDGQCVVIPPSCTTTTSTSTVVSDTTNSVVGEEQYAVATFVHSAWASISGSTWIWDAFHVAHPGQQETKDFEKQFTVSGTATAVTLELAADNGFIVWINGTQVAADATELNYSVVKTYTIDPSLIVSGVNTIKMEVTNFAIPESADPEANPAGALYKLTVTVNTCSNPPPPPVCPLGTTGDYPNCTPITETNDVCPNIAGVQSTLPEGYQLSEGQCAQISTGTPIIPPSGGGGGSSTFDYWGCTNKSATNYNLLANKDDGSCVVPGGNTGGDNGTTTGEVLGAATTTPELALPAGCSEYIHTYMRKGKKNDADDVSRLQVFLNETMDANIPVSGFFGNLTKGWVKKYQVKYHDDIIKPWYDAGYKGKDIENGTGYVYKTTKYQINLMKCSELTTPPPDLTPDL